MPSPELRERILWDAGGLFYRDGIGATGVNRVAAELGISKRTLYELFGSKDELVARALAARDAPVREEFTSGAEALSDDPAEQLVSVFAVLTGWLGAPDFRGCPFLNATAELAEPDHPARAVAAEHKEELRRWMERKGRRAGLIRPKALSEQLMMLFDGALSQAAIGGTSPRRAVDAAGTLVAAARPQSP